jgi:C1A family cysteine protease
MGWLREYPDFRDYTTMREEVAPRLKRLGEIESVRAMLTKVGVATPSGLSLPSAVDLRKWCARIEDQGNLGSCTAQAVVGAVEYFENKAFGKYIDASRLFLYKVTRTLMHLTGDTGAYLRTTMGGLVLFGVPPEEYWQYEVAAFDVEPSAFCYAYAQNYQAISYYRLDAYGTPTDALLLQIKANLAGKLPAVFGFTVYNSYHQGDKSGKIPYPAPMDYVVGGHAVVAVGYDDAMKIKNTSPGGKETKGALLIRNSWGEDWGDQGYGWLPYEYVLKGLAVDWWSLVKSEWIDTGQFGL